MLLRLRFHDREGRVHVVHRRVSKKFRLRKSLDGRQYAFFPGMSASLYRVMAVGVELGTATIDLEG